MNMIQVEKGVIVSHEQVSCIDALIRVELIADKALQRQVLVVVVKLANDQVAVRTAFRCQSFL